jgi:hypothetical protein
MLVAASYHWPSKRALPPSGTKSTVEVEFLVSPATKGRNWSIEAGSAYGS